MPKIFLHSFFPPKMKQGLFSALILKKRYIVNITFRTVYQIGDAVKYFGEWGVGSWDAAFPGTRSAFHDP